MQGIELASETKTSKTFFNLRLPATYPPLLFASSTKSVPDPVSFCELLGINASAITSAQQVHGSTIELVTSKNKGAKLPQCDGLITKEKDVPLLINTADCIAIAILDPDTPAIGLAHAGWRGSIECIAPKTATAMKEAFDTNIKNCIIAMSSSIGKCCYKVNGQVIDPLMSGPDQWREAAQPSRSGKWFLDLEALNRLQLLQVGARKEKIFSAGLCTSCNSGLFHSWRRERNKAGRMHSIAMIRKNR